MTIADATTAGLELLKEGKTGETTLDSPQWVDTVSAFDLPRSVLDSLKTLFGFCQLSHNWDSYGSPPPTENAINSAYKILLDVASLEDMPAPHVMALSGGGIHISWRRTNRELDLEILTNGEVDFLQSQEDHVIEEGEGVPRAKRLELMKWVTESAS